MKFPAIITTDLHLTANPRDEYRWGIFPWLTEQAIKHGAPEIAILGDLTDAKDYHSAELVNRLTKALYDLSDKTRVSILMGNHDYLKGGNPFFNFLNVIDGVRFITKPLVDTDGPAWCLWLPHSKNPTVDWADQPMNRSRFIFMHQTVNGATSESGQVMESSLSSEFKIGYKAQIYSGDIHVSQKIGDVEYVGTPYPIRFGDDARFRCLLLDANIRDDEIVATDLYFPSIKKMTIEMDDLRDLDPLIQLAGNQIKIRYSLAPEDRHKWPSIKKQIIGFCAEFDLDLQILELILPEKHRIHQSGAKAVNSKQTVEESLERFAEQQGIGGEALDVALQIVES
jgi:hypothetical protein